MELLHIENLKFSYPNTDKNTLDNVTVSVNKGDFILLCGETGSGKTTLLKMLKKEIAPHGIKSGKIDFNSKDISQTSSNEIGYVLQNPENQIVCDKVWHELAFGLENMGLENNIIRAKVAEMASYFGISKWFYKNTSELSGGQKQLLNLASVMVMSPDLLLLDEPTSQLDPIAANNFLNTLRRINRELGVTVIMTEHRTEDVFSIADKIMIIEHGKIISYGKPQTVCEEMKMNPVFDSFPSSVKIWQRTGAIGDCPLNISECREYINNNFPNKQKTASFLDFSDSEDYAVECKDISFRYSKKSEDIIKNLNLNIVRGEVHSILGANGEGKTTLLKLIGGILKAYKGKIKILDKSIDKYKNNELYTQSLTILPQNVQTVFIKETIEEDYFSYCEALGFDDEESQERIDNIVDYYSIRHLLERHPFDLSGGEQQKCAIAKLMLSKPDILLMDEPVKSLDAYSKNAVAEIIRNLSSEEITVILVTHDIEFAAEISDRCSLLFDGEIVSCDVPERMFEQNNFYTTSASRISRGYYNNAVTCDEVIGLCKKNMRGL